MIIYILRACLIVIASSITETVPSKNMPCDIVGHVKSKSLKHVGVQLGLSRKRRRSYWTLPLSESK